MGFTFRAAAISALSLLIAAPALADPHHGRGYDHDRRYERDYRDDRGRHVRSDRHDDRYERRDDRRHYRDGYVDGRRDGYRDVYRDEYAYRSGYEPRHYSGYREPHYRSTRVWSVGHRLPVGARYTVVNNYHHYRLPPPRHGHYYADCDGDVLLIAAATGLVVWALTN